MFGYAHWVTSFAADESRERMSQKDNTDTRLDCGRADGPRYHVDVGRRLLAAHCVLDAADGVLHLAFYLVALALGFELGIAQYLASNFLHFTLGSFSRALDAVFIHTNARRTRPPYG